LYWLGENNPTNPTGNAPYAASHEGRIRISVTEDADRNAGRHSLGLKMPRGAKEIYHNSNSTVFTYKGHKYEVVHVTIPRVVLPVRVFERPPESLDELFEDSVPYVRESTGRLDGPIPMEA
jgi:hypothetical protein